MPSSPSFLFRFTLAALGILLIGNAAFSQIPESSLVFTVEEQADGSVKISARGTAYATFPGNIINMPSDSATPSPPHTLANQSISPLPTGLVLTIPNSTEVSEEEVAPEEANPGFTDLPVQNVIFFNTGNWAFG